MRSPLVSIIIPMYEVEDYLPDCLDSVVNQTYRNLEIICVNDGSPDNCAKIVRRYQASDPRIVLVDKPNGGLSDARNAGIDIAKGDFLFFLDSDDYLEPSCIKTLVTLSQEKCCQISICQYAPFQGECADFSPSTEATSVIVNKSCSLYKLSYCRSDLKITLNTAWGKLYSRKLFESARYPVGKINEDEFLTYKLFLLANTACLIEAKLYGYRTREGSIMNSSPIPNDHKLDLINVYESRIIEFRGTGDAELVSLAADDLLYQISYLYRLSSDASFKRELRKLYRAKYKTYSSLLGAKAKMVRVVFFISPWLYQTINNLVERTIVS